MQGQACSLLPEHTRGLHILQSSLKSALGDQLSESHERYKCPFSTQGTHKPLPKTDDITYVPSHAGLRHPEADVSQPAATHKLWMLRCSWDFIKVHYHTISMTCGSKKLMLFQKHCVSLLGYVELTSWRYIFCTSLGQVLCTPSCRHL